MERPFGIAFVGIWNLIVAAIFLAIQIYGQLGTNVAAVGLGFFLMLMIPRFVDSVFFFLAGVGVIQGQKWAWPLAMVLGLSGSGALFGAIMGKGPGWLRILATVSGLCYLVTVVFLWQGAEYCEIGGGQRKRVFLFSLLMVAVLTTAETFFNLFGRLAALSAFLLLSF